jgi:tetratricopeptide (TPR) repeat protein/transcriptional regulator with XRE-family HTH domain
MNNGMNRSAGNPFMHVETLQAQRAMMAARMDSSFATLLRRHRLAAGLTQEELAERALISRRSVSDMERGVPHRPRNDTVTLLAEALGLSTIDGAAFVEAAQPKAKPSHTLNGTRPLLSSHINFVPPFVGRARELAALEEHLAGEGPPLLLLSGEPGIGKTRLLQTAISWANAAGLSCLVGGCQGRDSRDFYAPLLPALHGYVRAQAVDALRKDLRGCAWLVRLLPELAEGPIPRLPPWTLPSDQEQRLMVEAVIQLLRNIRGPAGTLLILDDLQWAGTDTLGLLTTLIHAAAGIPLRVIGAYMNTEIDSQAPLFALLADLASAGLASQRAVGPLAPQETQELLNNLLADDGDAMAARREEVLRRAGGVPFFLVSCAQGLSLGEEHKDAIPWDVAQSIRRRVSAVPPAARDLLGIAAIMGGVVPSRLLVSASTWPEGEVLAALDVTCQARLLEGVEEDGYRFVHNVIREVVEADLGIARRTVLHRRVAEALERGSGQPPIEQLAFHFAHSDAREKAIPYLEGTGDRAVAQFAHASAVKNYRDLVDLLNETGRVPDLGRACEKLGDALYRTGSHDAALPMLERADDAYRALGDVEGRTRALARIGWVHAVRGTQDQGITHIESALVELRAHTPSPGLATLYIALAQLFVVRGHFRENIAATERAVEIARETDDSQILGAAVAAQSDYLVALGRYDEALLAADEAARLSQHSGNLQALCTAYRAMIGAHLNKGEASQARAAGDQAVMIAERLGDPEVMTLALASRALTALPGEGEAARLDIERALSLRPDDGSSDATAFALMQYGRYFLYRGDWDDAARYLNRCLDMVERNHQKAWAQTFLAQLDLVRGHPELARERLLPIVRQEDPAEPMTIWVDGARVTLAEAHMALGDLDGADTILTPSIAWQRWSGNPHGIANALRVQATLHIQRGRWTEAALVLEEALCLVRGISRGYLEGLLLETYGQLHIAKGEWEPARLRLEGAVILLRQVGTHKDVERVDAVLTEMG